MVSAEPALLLRLGTTALSLESCSVGVLLLAALAWLALHVWQHHAVGSHAIPAGVASPPGCRPLLGHALPILANLHRIHDWLLEQSRAVKEATFAFSIPLLPTYFVVSDPASLEHVLKTRMPNYNKGATFRHNLGPLLGHGIFTSDGSAWHWQRKLAANVFSVKSFKRCVDVVFAQKMALLDARLAAAAAAAAPAAACPSTKPPQPSPSSTSSSRGANVTAVVTTTPTSTSTTANNTNNTSSSTSRRSNDNSPTAVDLHDLMHRFTLDSFAAIGFGVDPGCLSRPDKVPFAVAFDRSQVLLNERFWSSCWWLSELLNGRALTIARDSAAVRAFAADIITKRRALLATASVAGTSGGGGHAADGGADDGAGSVPRDLLSLFLEAPGPDGRPLSHKQLVDAVLNFIIAGRDTTAQALSWTLYHLMRNPGAEARLLEELASVLGPQAAGGAGATGPAGADAASAPPRRLSYDQVRSLTFTRACFLEALRLCPSVPEDLKIATEADVLPDGTHIPAGAQVLYSPYVVNRMRSFWGDDADEFRPERWLAFSAAPSPYRFLSFNAGPRLCLGQRLAELEAVYVLASLLPRYRFELADPNARVTYQTSSTLPMAGGLPVLVSRRGA